MDVRAVLSRDARRDIRDCLLGLRKAIEDASAALVRIEDASDRARLALDQLGVTTAEIRRRQEALEAAVAMLRASMSAAGLSAPGNMKAARLLEILRDIPQSAPQRSLVMEVGAMRYPFETPLEGASTLHLGRWCNEHSRRLLSVDVEAQSLAIARSAAERSGIKVDFLRARGVDAIRALRAPVLFLYLDGSNDPEEALAEFQAAESLLEHSAVIAVDDVQPLGDRPLGKGTLVLPYAESRGFTVEIFDTEPGFKMAAIRRAG
jgi:predicted O-methyltransferase YrrM